MRQALDMVLSAGFGAGVECIVGCVVCVQTGCLQNRHPTEGLWVYA